MTDERFSVPERKLLLEFLYETKFGAMTLEVLTKPVVSRVAGAFFDSYPSKGLIAPFKKIFNVNASEAEDREYFSFNDFFTRKLKEGARVIDEEKSHLISPCDSFLSVFKIDGDSKFTIKNCDYSVESLTRSKRASELYKGGYCAIFRLTCSDYHRYIYFDDVRKGDNRYIEGVLHTVNPVATTTRKVYTENCREMTVMETENFGKVTQIEVGALLVGRIDNNHQSGSFKRGEEKGKFLYGGSTIVLLFEKDRVNFDDELIENSLNGYEKKVFLGEMIGEKI